MKQSPRLSEDEVLERLDLCTSREIINEMFSLGQVMTKEIIDSIRVLESKAASFALYGTGIATLLVSSSAIWGKLGNQWTAWIGVCAGIAALMCVVCSVKSLSFKQYEIISQDDWMSKEYLNDDLKMKKYHVYTIWGAMDSRLQVQLWKSRELRHGLFWLKVSVVVLAYLLVHIAFIQSVAPSLWLTLTHRVGVINILGVSFFQTAFNLLCCLICAFTLWIALILVFWFDRRFV